MGTGSGFGCLTVGAGAGVLATGVGDLAASAGTGDSDAGSDLEARSREEEQSHWPRKQEQAGSTCLRVLETRVLVARFAGGSVTDE